MIRKRKLFSRPRKAYEKSRILDENKILKKYGLKSKREIWKTKAKIDYLRGRAKALAKSSGEEQEVLFGKLRYLGLNINSIADVLALKTEDLLERRLATIVAKKGLATTPQQARQMIGHKRILIDNNVVSIPSFIVSVDQEKKVSLKMSKPKVSVKEESQNE